MKLALPLLALIAAAAAQSTCTCRTNDAGTCNTIQEDILVGGALTCTVNPTTCSGCVCDPLGGEVCQVESRTHLEFNGTNNFCETVVKDVAFCPGNFPATNLTDCCINIGTGTEPVNNCVLQSPVGLGITDPILNIYRYLDVAYNSSGNFTNGNSQVSYQATLGIEAEYSPSEFASAGVPTDLFTNISSVQSTDPVILAPNEFHTFDISLLGEAQFGAYPQGSPGYNAFLALTANTFDFDFAVQVVQIFPAGTSQDTRWATAHCVAYETGA